MRPRILEANAQTKPESITSMRDQLRSNEGVRFIDRAEFCQLLISAKDLDRCDFPHANVRGLFDANSGLKFLIEEEELFSGSIVGLNA